MTGGFPEVKVISFGLHKHRHGRNVRVKKLCLYCFSRGLQKHHALVSVEVVPLHCIDYDYNYDYYFHYYYDYDGNELFVFLEV